MVFRVPVGKTMGWMRTLSPLKQYPRIHPSKSLLFLHPCFRTNVNCGNQSETEETGKCKANHFPAIFIHSISITVSIHMPNLVDVPASTFCYSLARCNNASAAEVSDVVAIDCDIHPGTRVSLKATHRIVHKFYMGLMEN